MAPQEIQGRNSDPPNAKRAPALALLSRDSDLHRIVGFAPLGMNNAEQGKKTHPLQKAQRLGHPAVSLLSIGVSRANGC